MQASSVSRGPAQRQSQLVTGEFLIPLTPDLPFFSVQVPVLSAPKMLSVSMTLTVPATLDTLLNLGRNSSCSPWRHVKVNG